MNVNNQFQKKCVYFLVKTVSCAPFVTSEMFLKIKEFLLLGTSLVFVFCHFFFLVVLLDESFGNTSCRIYRGYLPGLS